MSWQPRVGLLNDLPFLNSLYEQSPNQGGFEERQHVVDVFTMPEGRITVCEARHKERLNLVQIRHNLQSIAVQNPQPATVCVNYARLLPQRQCLGHRFTRGADELCQFGL